MSSGIQLFPKKHSPWRYSACAALIAGALAGCGGGGGGGGGGNPVTLTGAVIDGYISGATVCLDLNNNQSCDAGEPTAKSGDKGSYSLDVTGITIDALKTSHLLTVVTEEAKDSDDGVKTLKEVGKAPFSLLAPVAAYVGADNSLSKAVISPLTTLVSHDMIVNQTPLAGAQSAVRYTLGLTDTVDLKQDFVTNKETDLHQQARVIAAALGQAQSAIKGVDVSSRDAFFAAMTYVQENAKELKSTLVGDVPVAKQVSDKMKLGAFSPKATDLLSKARSITQSSPASSVTSVLSEGVYLADLLEESTPQYTKVSVTNGQISVTGYEKQGSQWIARKEDGGYEFVLTKDGWQEDKGCENGSIQDTGSAKATLTCTYGTATISMRTLDIAGKTLADLGQSAPASFKDFKFPAGSKAQLTVFTNSTDEYQIWAGNSVSGTNGNPLSSIDSFMGTYTNNNNGPRFYPGDGSGFSFTFDPPTAADAKSGTVSLWPFCTTTGNTPCNPSLGKATYEIKTVHGQEVLIVRAKPMGEAPGNFFLFGVRGGNLYSGVYRPAFTGSEADGSLNKTAMNAVLEKAGLPKIN